MMMEAIRLSLAAEEDRKRKEEKDAVKDAKKRAKEARKEEKRAEKMAKKNGSSSSLYLGANDSHSTWTASQLDATSSSIAEEQIQGKGKLPAQDFAGFNPLTEPTSTLNTEMQDDDSDSPPTSLPIEDPQRHLEESRAHLTTLGSAPIPTTSITPPPPHIRQLSNDSSAASSFVDSAPGSLRMDSDLPSRNASGLDMTTGTPDATTPALAEPMLNFQSLAAMIGEEDQARESEGRGEHIEHSTPQSSAV